jgi:hypothetical protein
VVIASNNLESSSNVTFTIEVMISSDPRVMDINIDDGNTVTSSGETKWFYISFVEVGVDTCVIVDFADGAQESIGHKAYCDVFASGLNASGVDYTSGVDMAAVPIVVTHTYKYVFQENLKYFG